jgi:signal-transduction protein with cAMP-binding, CBS, and nucleotidyltransferase domain
MLVRALSDDADRHLVTLADHALLIEAAALLRAGTDLVVVCAADGTMAGVVSKTDVVDQISHCEGASCTCAVSMVMTRQVLSCRLDDDLFSLWTEMKDRGLKNVPLLDNETRPLGIVTARAALQVLLKESEREEELLRDYVMGFGYR